MNLAEKSRHKKRYMLNSLVLYCFSKIKYTEIYRHIINYPKNDYHSAFS